MATIHSPARAAIAAALCVAAGTALGACVSRPRVGGAREGAASGAPADARRGAVAAPDMSAVYRQMGLIGGTGELPFVGSVAHFAAATPDSTHVLLTLSLPNRALAFVREGDRYRASYHVRLDARRGGTSVRQVATDEVVRVATFRETARTDESVLFYQWLTLAPGTYALAVAMRDAEGGRSSALDVPLEVPRLGPGALSTPAAAYDVVPRARLDTLPRLVATARAAVTFGHDSLVLVYVEGYAAAPASGVPLAPRLPVRATARGEGGVVVWTDTAALERRAAGVGTTFTQLYSGVVRVPVARLGIGVVTVDVERLDAAARVGERVSERVSERAPGPDAARDPARVALFVALGEDLPITGFDEVVRYLRHYATPERLRALRDTTPATRAVAWSAFLRDSDPVAATPEHEGLRDYFARIRAANVRFGEEGSAGWLTDRGMAYVGLGEPDQIFEPGGPDVNTRGRQQIWDYRTPRLQLVFTDQSGYGRWRLTPQSANEVQAAIRQRLVR